MLKMFMMMTDWGLTASFRQVVGHRRAIKDFSGLKIIVNVLEVVCRVEQQTQRLSSNGVDDVS